MTRQDNKQIVSMSYGVRYVMRDPLLVLKKKKLKYVISV